MLQRGFIFSLAFLTLFFDPQGSWSEETRTYGTVVLKSGSKLTGWIEESTDGAMRVSTESGVILLTKERIAEISAVEPPPSSDELDVDLDPYKPEEDKTYPIAHTEEDLVECFKKGHKLVFYQGEYAYLMPDGLYYRDTEAYDLEMHLLHQHLVRYNPIYSAEGIAQIPEVDNWREFREQWETQTPVINFRGAQAFFMSNNRYYWSQEDFNSGLYEYAKLKLPEEYYDGKKYPVRYFLEKPKDTNEVERLVELVRTDFERKVARELVESTHSDYLLNVFLTRLSELDHIRFEKEREARKVLRDINNRAPIRHSIFVIGKYRPEFRNPRCRR